MRVGVIYALLRVRSPAAPANTLIGLLEMLIGEQVVPTVKLLTCVQAGPVSGMATPMSRIYFAHWPTIAVCLVHAAVLMSKMRLTPHRLRANG